MGGHQTWLHQLRTVAIARVDRSGGFMEANACWHRLTRTTADSCAGTSWMDAFVDGLCLDGMGPGEVRELRTRLSRGLLPVLVKLENTDAELLCIVEPLGTDSDRLATLFEALPDLLFELDASGHIIDYRSSSSDRLSHHPDEFMGRHFAGFFPPELAVRLQDAMNRARADHQVQQVEYELDTHTGRGWFEARMAATPAGGVLVLVRDFTELYKQREVVNQAVAQAREANVARSRFLANVSHEIRTPLNGLMGVVQLLERGDLDAEQVRLVQGLRESSRTMQRLIEDILDVAKLESGTSSLSEEVFHLGNLMEQVRTVHQSRVEQAGMRLELRVDPAAQDVVGDPIRLMQVLGNLVDNAIKYAGRGKLEIRLTCDGPDHWRFSVADEGPGVPVALRQSVFEPFQQLDASIARHSPGIGLGLAICREWVQLMGGRIWVEETSTRSGANFCFEVRLPEASTVIDPTGDCALAPNRVLSVLVVEDHPVNAMVVSTMLLRDGHQVERAKDGAEAVTAVQRGQHDLILMDVHMPGTDGLWASRRIRGLGYTTPIVGLTADVGAQTRGDCLTAGMNEVMLKPVDWDVLRRVLEELA